MEYRENVVMERISISDRNVVRREIERNDAAHANVIQYFFAADWREAEQYDIVLNTERLPIDICVDLVAQMATSSAFQETEASKNKLADKLIEARIRNRIEEAIGNRAPVFNVFVDSGKVALSGRIENEGVITQVEHLVREITGVTPIVNSMEKLPRPLNGA